MISNLEAINVDNESIAGYQGTWIYVLGRGAAVLVCNPFSHGYIPSW